MDIHKSLYKEHRTPQHKRVNRVLQEANRNKQRRDRFQNSRNISPSPVKLKEIIIPLCQEEKENAGQEDNPNSTRLAKLICNASNPEKLTKQEEFLKRFIEWKENKKNKKQEVINKPKNFVSAVNGARQTATTSALVPKGHHKGFRAPEGLKLPMEDIEKAEINNKSVIKARQSIYTVVPTPPRKTKENDEKLRRAFPIARKALPQNLHKKIVNSNKTPNSAAASVTKSTSKLIATNILNNKPIDCQKHNTLRKNPAWKSTLESKSTTATAIQPVIRSNLKPRVLKMPPPPSRGGQKLTEKKPEESKKSVAAPIRQTGAPSKIKAMTSKSSQNDKQAKKSPSKVGARLAQNLKAKKPLNTSKKNIQAKSKNIINLFKNDNEVVEEMVLQTPKDFTLNPFEEFVTSTKIKNCSQNVDNLNSEDISPIEPSPKTSHGVKKFNFIRYSEVAVVTDDEEKDNNENREKEGNNGPGDENKTLVNVAPEIDEKTPTKTASEDKPNFYLSPFVSVSRGKVSLKKEKEKRNSIYLQTEADNSNLATEITSPKSPKYSVEVRRTLEAVRYFRKQLQDEIERLLQLCEVWEEYKNENLEKIQNANGEDMINVTIGQTRLLTSKKFMQFKGLIDRCESGATGIGAVEYDGSEDTKPITSVDLEGFWSMLGLQVDNLDKRFDTLNRWKLNDWVDPDEVKSKIKKKLTKVMKAKAVPATKAKPNSALQQMLRKMQAEMRKNKQNKNYDINGEPILTESEQNLKRSTTSISSMPINSSNNSTSRRLSIVVKDRKYFSPAATVISVSSPNRRTSMMQRKTSQDSPKLSKYVEKFNDALDNMQTSFDLRKSVLTNGNSRRMSLNPKSPITTAMEPTTTTKNLVGATEDEVASTSNFTSLFSQSPQPSPVLIGRKSILKTPGTAKSKLRNVIFNEKLRVKKFNFLINKDELNTENEADDTNASHEEDLAERDDEEQPKRTLTLRNRKVRLRPSSEIVIPIK